MASPGPRPERRFRWAPEVVGEGIIPLPRPSNAPPSQAMSNYYKRCKTDRFLEWRRGNYDWKVENRQAEINAIVHPKPGTWDPWDLREPDNTVDVEYNVFEGTDARREGDETAQDLEENRQATESLIDRFRRAGFDQVVVLGRENAYLTVRFGMTDDVGTVHTVVCRVDITGRQPEERFILQRIYGAKHIQQRVPIRGMPNPGDEQQRNARADLDYDYKVVIMEDVRRGNLGSWLARLATENRGKPLNERERPPERILWSILYCLYRACVGMAYPQKVAGGGPGGAKAPVAVVPEDIPQGRSRETRPTDSLVHFNLCPSNVLVGEFDDGVGHEIFPILKVSNFTQAAFPKTAIFDLRNDEEKAEQYLWGLRERGRPDSFLPEQTSEAWDHMPNLAALQTSFIAGNYGANSNIFHAGLIMHQIITGCSPPKPLIPRSYSMPDAEKTATGWTYGYALLSQYEDWRIDERGTVWPSEDLRNTVARCMEYIPARRWGLRKLGARINAARRGLAQEDNVDSDDGNDDYDEEMDDEEIRQWAEWSISGAPAQSDPTELYFDEDSMDIDF